MRPKSVSFSHTHTHIHIEEKGEGIRKEDKRKLSLMRQSVFHFREANINAIIH